MSAAPSSYPCPHCGTVASAQSGCPSCGRGPDTDALEVLRLDAEIAGLNQRLHTVRTEVAGLERQLADTSKRRNAAAYRVQDAVREAAAGHPQAPAPALAAAPRGPHPGAPVPPHGVPAPPHGPPVPPQGAPIPPQGAPALSPGAPLHPHGAPLPPFPAQSQPPAPVESKLTTLTVQNVLFALGGLLLLVAAAVFTAVAWAQVGVTGRALLLGAATVAVLAVPPFAARRGLIAAAETLAAVGLLMILLDGYAAWAVDFLGVTNAAPQIYAAVVCAVTAATALGYSRLVRLTGPRIAALVIAQPVLPLAAAAQDFTTAGWSLTLTAVTVLNVAVLRLRPNRFAGDVIGGLAYACGGTAAVLSALLAASELLAARTIAGAALAGFALVLISLVAVGTAVLAGSRIAQSVTGGVLVAAVGAALTGPAVRQWPDLLTLGVVALALTAAVLAISPRLPAAVRRGPLIGLYAVVAVPTIGVVITTLIAANRTILAADILHGAAWNATIPGIRWQAVAAVAAVVCAYLLLLPSRTRTDLGLTALLAIAFLAPAAFRLPWWTAAVAGVLTAGVALALAALRRPTPASTPPQPEPPQTEPSQQTGPPQTGPPQTTPSRTGPSQTAPSRTTPSQAALTWPDVALAIRLCVAGVAGGYAVIIGLGHPGVGAGVCASFAVIGLVIAVIAHSAARQGPAATAAWVIGLLAAPAAVWQALIAGDTSQAVQVRAMFAVVVLIVAVAHVVGRLLPKYAWSTVAVAFLLVAASPVWALGGPDPVSVYAAGALLLVAALLPLEARSGVAAAATPAAAAPAAATPAAATPAAAAPAAAAPAAAAPAAATPGLGEGFGSALLASLVPVIMLVISTGADLAAVLIEPLRELTRVWSGPTPDPSPVAWSTVVAILLSAVAAAVAAVVTAARGAGSTWSERYRAAAWATAPLIALVVPLTFAAAGATWPATPIATLVTGLVGLVAAALLPSVLAWSALLVVVSAWLATVGVVSAMPTHSGTLIAFGLLVVASAVVGVAGRAEPARIAGWVAGTLSVAVVTFTAADTIGLAKGGVSRSVLAAAAIAAVLEWVLARRRPREAPAVAAVAHSTAFVALLLAGSLGRAAVICTLWSIVLVVRAMVPGTSRRGRFGYSMAAAVVVLFGWWLFLLSRDVETPEIYTLPAAALALAVGWLARRQRPELPSWTTYGPSLGAAFLPSFAVIGNSADPQYLRRLLIGLGALAVLILGARVRAQAPVVVGAGALILIALHEVIQFWDLVPRWVPLALGGILLLVIATTMEQRRRDLLRLRNAVGRMS